MLLFFLCSLTVCQLTCLRLSARVSTHLCIDWFEFFGLFVQESAPVFADDLFAISLLEILLSVFRVEEGFSTFLKVSWLRHTKILQCQVKSIFQ